MNFLLDESEICLTCESIFTPPATSSGVVHSSPNKFENEKAPNSPGILLNRNSCCPSLEMDTAVLFFSLFIGLVSCFGSSQFPLEFFTV